MDPRLAAEIRVPVSGAKLLQKNTSMFRKGSEEKPQKDKHAGVEQGSTSAAHAF